MIDMSPKGRAIASGLVVFSFLLAETMEAIAQEPIAETDTEASVRNGKVIGNLGPGSISGTVLTMDSGELPADLVLTLHLVPDETRYVGAIDTVLAESEPSVEGKYWFENLQLCRYVLFAKSQQYTVQSVVTLTKERPESTQDLQLYGAWISGTVVNSDGNGISDGHVYLAEYISGGHVQKFGWYFSRGTGVETDDEGAFRIGNLVVQMPDLQFRLIATAPGYSSQFSFLLSVFIRTYL